MSGRGNSPVRHWLRLALLVVAILAILFVATGADIFHIDAPGSAATCPICHLGHLSPLPGASAVLLSAPVPLAQISPARAPLRREPPSALIPPPRAPPA
jgi:hypothetical protein